jgi:acetyl-CoA carboxylase carboxyl transferase subunit beta
MTQPTTRPTVRPARAATGTLLETVLDADSWQPWDQPVDDPVTDDPGYAEELRQTRERTGADESVLSGEGTIHGHRVAILVSEYDFLAGSIGVAAGQRLVAAVRHATAEGLPLIASPASGGTRMQEGTTAFLQMAAVTTALQEHRAACLPFLVYLRHPTTGGVLASWGSLGHLAAAEPGALVGFLGPRVYQVLYGEPFPAGVQTAENLRDHGLIDAVLRLDELREVAARLLGVAEAGRALRIRISGATAAPVDLPATTVHEAVDPTEALRPVPAAEVLQRSRRVDRPGVRALLRHACQDVTVFHATGSGELDEAMVVALARLDALPCVIVGQDRIRQRERALHPAGLRAARRGMRLATELHLPLVTLIDTPGAELSQSAEEGGLAGEIARCLNGMLACPVPTVSVLFGEGTGGAALALFPTDRTLAAQFGWLSPLPPEGASAIVHRNIEHAAEMAQRQHIMAPDLFRRGIVDAVIPECPDAADEPVAFVRRVAAAVHRELDRLVSIAPDARLAARRERYLNPTSRS